jgi:hypothetical protein
VANHEIIITIRSDEIPTTVYEQIDKASLVAQGPFALSDREPEVD